MPLGRILFCSIASFSTRLGYTKVTLELAEEMRLLGWECELRGPEDICDSMVPDKRDGAAFAESQRRYLRRRAVEFDVVEYGHEYLPFSRTEFPSAPLMVARSVFLTQHLAALRLPLRRGLRPRLRRWVYGRRERARLNWLINSADATAAQADVVNVSNYRDKEELIRRAIPSAKIAVLPYGISRQRRPLFDAVPSAIPAAPCVAFVGSFDPRKGCREFPELFRRIRQAVPGTTLRLLGTKSMLRTAADVLNSFPRSLRSAIDVVPTFEPDDLPRLLAPCSVGVFPSHVEGFGFGVLEMLASAIPVFAYDAPGVDMMLSSDEMVPRGDANAISEKVIDLLNRPEKLAQARVQARERSRDFDWRVIAEQTSSLYLARRQLRDS